MVHDLYLMSYSVPRVIHTFINHSNIVRNSFSTCLTILSCRLPDRTRCSQSLPKGLINSPLDSKVLTQFEPNYFSFFYSNFQFVWCKRFSIFFVELEYVTLPVISTWQFLQVPLPPLISFMGRWTSQDILLLPKVGRVRVKWFSHSDSWTFQCYPR